MELLHERCAALDIGKKDLKACVRRRVRRASGRAARRSAPLATTTNALLELRDWLVAERVSLVVMEATGDYWRGAFYLLEDDLNVILVNAAHAKGLPGRKTDVLTELVQGFWGGWVPGGVRLAPAAERVPNIDQLAREGMFFSRYYVTAPTCAPSPQGAFHRNVCHRAECPKPSLRTGFPRLRQAPARGRRLLHRQRDGDARQVPVFIAYGKRDYC